MGQDSHIFSIHSNILMFILQLKIYAAEQSIAPSINDDYDSKGESLETLCAFHNGSSVFRGSILSGYTFTFQLVFPYLISLLAWSMLYYLIDNNKLELIRHQVDTSDLKAHKANEADHSQQNMGVYMTIIVSYCSVLYILILDCIALGSRSELVTEEIFHNPKYSSRNYLDNGPLVLEFVILFFCSFKISSCLE